MRKLSAIIYAMFLVGGIGLVCCWLSSKNNDDGILLRNKLLSAFLIFQPSQLQLLRL